MKLAHAKIMLKNSIREYTIVLSTIGYLLRQTLYYISYIGISEPNFVNCGTKTKRQIQKSQSKMFPTMSQLSQSI